MTADRNQAGYTDASGAHGAGLVVMWVRRRTSGLLRVHGDRENLHDGRNDDDPGRHRRVGRPGRGQERAPRARPRPGRRHPVRQAGETGREGHPLDAGTPLQARPRIAGRGPAQHHRLPAPDGGAGHGDRGRLPARRPELVKLFVFGVCFINKVPFVRGMRPRVGRGPVSSWSSCAPR